MQEAARTSSRGLSLAPPQPQGSAVADSRGVNTPPHSMVGLYGSGSTPQESLQAWIACFVLKGCGTGERTVQSREGHRSGAAEGSSQAGTCPPQLGNLAGAAPLAHMAPGHAERAPRATPRQLMPGRRRLAG